ncbi:25975_t:CDS:2, partial [Gigaspora rosea]
MEPTFNSEHFMRHQVSNFDSSQEFLESDHELVDLSQEVTNSFHNVEESYQGLTNSFQELMNFPQINSFQELMDFPQETLCDEIRDEIQVLVGINGPLPHINKAIVFAIDDTFPNWSIAEHYVAEYGRQKGFVAIKICNKTDRNGHLINLYYKCEFSRTYQPKKTNNLPNQHNKGSKKLNCDWKPDTKIFAPVNRQFSNDCHEEIRHLVVNSQCDLSTIRSLLSVKYPNQLFLIHDLANTVAQLRREHNAERSEASQLLKQLYEYREKDSNWYIEPLVDPISNQLCGIFWMDPGQRERWIQFCDIIVQNNMAQTNHYNFSLCLFVLIDNHNKTRIAAQALMPDETIESFRWLFLSKESWACCYTFKIFTGGMQSTQRVEELNNHIKTAINSSLTLLQVIEAIHQRIERESLSQHFNLWSQDRIDYNDHLILQTVFSQVVQQIN